MATKTDFTPEEWQSIMTAPGLTTMYIVVAAPSGPIGAVKELMASGKTIAGSLERGAANPLLQAVFEDLKAQMEAAKDKKEKPSPVSPELEQKLKQAKTPDAARAVIGGDLQQVLTLITSKATADEMSEFNGWLMVIAHNVAEAAKEGGFLGFGGTPVSDAEQAALNDLSGMLGIAPATSA